MRMQRRLRRADRDALPVRKDGGLDGGAMRDRLLRGDGAVGLLAPKVVAKKRPDLSHASGPSDEDELVDVPRVQAYAGEHLHDGVQRAHEETRCRVVGLEVGAREHEGRAGGERRRQLDLDRGARVAVVKDT
mmetsp:Transcript_36159/g.116117  ORF Transcript_36159/g.116117 Transcript_36159/m.116117 type:complete len:132 (+) Transcript_36159:387-782(+)